MYFSLGGAEIGNVLFSEEAISDRIAELAAEISETYADKELTLLAILKGSYIFVADLCRRLTIPARVDFLGVRSYDGADSSGNVILTTPLTSPLEGRHVLVVEDIVDTGRTLSHVLDWLGEFSPASLRLCAFLDKPERRVVPVSVDYVGFRIPNVFVVGYGLDYDGWYRHLPFIAELVIRPPER